MKRTVIICLSILLVIAASVTAFAAGKAEFSVTASETKLYRGDSVTLTASVACGEAATSYGLSLEYDANVFELVEGKCSVEGTLVSSFNEGFAFMFQNPTAYSGSVGTVTFKVKDGASFADHAIKAVASVKNGNAEVAAEGCTVNVKVECKHTYGEWAAVETGHARTCSVCQNVVTEAHVWDEGVVTKEATCIAEGELTYTCTSCKATKKEAVKMLDHNYGEWVKVDENNHKHICKGCNKEETEAHKFDETLTAGEKTHWNACVCGEKKNETEHTFDETKWRSDGENHWHACSCGAKNSSAAHSWDGGKVTTAPAVQKEGVKTFTCKDCGAVREEKIPALSPYGNPQTGSHTMIIAIVMAVISAGGAIVCASFKKKTVR